jgi:hypothetical protein
MKINIIKKIAGEVCKRIDDKNISQISLSGLQALTGLINTNYLTPII